MSASGLLVPSTQASLGIGSGGGSSGPIVVDIHENAQEVYAVNAFPADWSDIPSFAVQYTPTSNGKITVNVNAMGYTEQGSIEWALTLFINGQNAGNPRTSALMTAYSIDTPVVLAANTSFSYAFSVDEGASTNIALKGRSIGDTVSPNGGFTGVSWSVIFYPS